MSRRMNFILTVVVFLSLIPLTRLLAEVAEANRPEIAEANLPQIALQVTTEENQKTILATVTASGKPLKGATVTFFVKRMFGNLDIGHDQTLDDGTAAIPFPADLSGGTTGQLQVIATITDPPQYFSAHDEATFDGALAISPQAKAFPRALWAPQAPLPLILAITIVLILVWGTYVYVVVQLIKALYKA
jgi:hypothetical protein